MRSPLLGLALEVSELPTFKAEVEDFRRLFLALLVVLLYGRAKEEGLDEIEAL